MIGATRGTSARGRARLFAAAGLLGALLAGNLQLHHHSITAGDPGAAASGDQFLTRHNPLSHASHLHAVIATVHDGDCVTCHVQRVSQAAASSRLFEAPSASGAATAHRPERAHRASRSSTRPRAPPISSR